MSIFGEPRGSEMTSRPDEGPGAAVERAQIVGTGLIGGSVGLALKGAGWHVTGSDARVDVEQAALRAGVVDAVGTDRSASLVVICTPSAQVVGVAQAALDASTDPGLIVTDVSGIKAAIVEGITDPRFIGGHPMAGSEQVGVAGARADLFVGATWVLTPGAATPPASYGRLLAIVRSLGAQGLALSAPDHDRLVAHVSHVPHLVASALMNEAAAAAESDAALLLLAAGGFRDMTRVAAGDPSIWPDLCVENASAILETLDALETQLSTLREAIAAKDRSAISRALVSASAARQALPGRAADPDQLCEVRIPVPDRPGVLAEVTAAASELGVSVVDVEIAHSVEGGRGVLIVVVAREQADRYAATLRTRGFSCTVVAL